MHLLFSCEHASGAIPDSLKTLFAQHAALLDSHRGLDLGALALARQFARTCQAPLQAARFSRLVVDLNRSANHPNCLSEITKQLSNAARAALLADYYWPYRQALIRRVDTACRTHQAVLHVGVHSFTPIWRGCARRVDVGLLYDPQRPAEVAFCRAWHQALQLCRPHWRIRRNNPYRGRADGVTTTIRRRLPQALYLGIEVEMNQALVQGSLGHQRAARSAIVEAFCMAWQSFAADAPQAPRRR